jgi:FkbM family methyltransferase
MALLNTLQFILTHPLNKGQPLSSLGRYASWQLRSRFSKGPFAIPFVDTTSLLVSKGQTGATGNVYAGLHEPGEMAFVLHVLRDGDLFVDVGANVGSYTILAAGGAGAEVVAFEPGLEAYQYLAANVRFNNLGGRVDARSEAVGASPGLTAFTSGRDTINHVATASETDDSVQVVMTTLDTALAGRCPAVIKIDVEGYESAVLSGAAATLACSSLLAVSMETNGSGDRYSASDDAIYESMIAMGFTPCTYDPFKREITRMTGPANDGNTIFVRDIDRVSARVRSARKFNIAGRRWL